MGSTVEDLVRNVKGTRVFKRYPWYKIENMTGEAVTLKTYSTTDFVFLVPAMTVEVKPGMSYMDASAGDVEKEQAVFCMPDGREYKLVIEGSQTVILKNEYFMHFPYYEVENLTGEEIALETYDTMDFMCLVPSMTVVVKPGKSYILASSRNVLEEQAVFTLFNGRN